MKRPLLVMLALLGAAGCSSDDPAGSADAAPAGEAVPTYTADVQPILEAKCGPCHTTGGAGGVNHATDFAATRQPSNVCAGSMVFECMLERVQDGSMPEGAGCTGDPSLDADNGSCLTADEQAILSAWVAAGGPEGTSQDQPDPDPDPDPGPYDPY